MKLTKEQKDKLEALKTTAEIRAFFEAESIELNPNAREVLVFKGMKQISVTRRSVENNDFFRTFIRRYTK